MTEEEAKKKYCPFAPAALGQYDVPIVTVGVGMYSQGTGVPMRQLTCQGSNCMMWRQEHVGGSCGLVSRHG